MESKRERRYVPVVVRFDAEGNMRPLEIEFDGKRYPVEAVIDRRRAACESAGGIGERFTCQIYGKISYLWNEEGRWFVAALV